MSEAGRVVGARRISKLIARFRCLLRDLSAFLVLLDCFGGALCAGTAARSAFAATPDSLLSAARAAAHRDDHATAIAGYLELFRLEPALRDSASPELAAQFTWAQRYEEALSEFGWFLVRHPGRGDVWMTRALAESWSDRVPGALDSYRRVLALDPRNRDAALGEARMLSWLGRSGEALARYEALARNDPSCADAWLGVAQVLSWNGENRRALEVCRTLTDTGTPNPQAWEQLATVYNNLGRADLALAALDRAAASGAGSPGTERLGRTLRSQWPARITAAADRASDSDRFAGQACRVQWESPLRFRGHVRLGTARNRYARPGNPVRSDQWITAAADWRFVTALAISANGDLQTDRPGGAAYSPLNAGAAAIWTPADHVRADFGWSRFALFSYEVYPSRITGSQTGAGLTVRVPCALLTLPEPEVVAAGDRVRFSDDNTRVQARAFVRQLLRSRRPRLQLEAGTLYQDAARWTGHGYWCPDRNRVLHARLLAEVEPAYRVLLRADLDGGTGREGNGRNAAFLAYGGSVGWSNARLRLEVSAAHSGPYERTRAGYRRSFGTFSAAVAF